MPPPLSSRDTLPAAFISLPTPENQCRDRLLLSGQPRRPRGQTVKKGETVAQLDSELQRLAVELAQVNSERKRLTYRSSEAERALALYAQCLGDGPEKFPMVGISMGGEL